MFDLLVNQRLRRAG